jgi:hypothetical protein
MRAMMRGGQSKHPRCSSDTTATQRDSTDSCRWNRLYASGLSPAMHNARVDCGLWTVDCGLWTMMGDDADRTATKSTTTTTVDLVG